MIEKKRKTELDIDLTIQSPVVEAPPPPPPEPEPVPEPEPAKAKPSRRKLYIIAGVSSVTALLAVIALAVYFGAAQETAEKVPEEKPVEVTAAAVPTAPMKELNNLPLEPFILPIIYNNRKGFVRIKFSLLLSNTDAASEVEENLSLMRESIYLFAKQRELGDFKPTGKRNQTIQTLRRLLNRSLQNGRVEDVMITEFTLL
ncbi:MAG: flagellar basal body-associated protein FliL [Nitrospinota bacterium]